MFTVIVNMLTINILLNYVQCPWYIIYVYVYESYITIYTFKKLINKENTKKNHKRVVSVYVIQIHVDIHKL